MNFINLGFEVIGNFQKLASTLCGSLIEHTVFAQKGIVRELNMDLSTLPKKPQSQNF